MKRRYLNGFPVYRVGERVEVMMISAPGTPESWVSAIIEKRYMKAEIPSGKRSYEYGVGEVGGNIGVHGLIDDAAFVRVPRQAPRVLRAKVKQ